MGLAFKLFSVMKARWLQMFCFLSLRWRQTFLNFVLGGENSQCLWCLWDFKVFASSKQDVPHQPKSNFWTSHCKSSSLLQPHNVGRNAPLVFPIVSQYLHWTFIISWGDHQWLKTFFVIPVSFLPFQIVLLWVARFWILSNMRNYRTIFFLPHHHYTLIETIVTATENKTTL